ncbi:hypothetical protein Tco_1350796 [Tanacetum coccineum]
MEHETETEKSPEKMKSGEKMEEDDVATQKEMKKVSTETGTKRKKSIPRKSTRKRQKIEEDFGNGYLKNKAKNDKTKHENEKSVKKQSKSKSTPRS